MPEAYNPDSPVAISSSGSGSEGDAAPRAMGADGQSVVVPPVSEGPSQDPGGGDGTEPATRPQVPPPRWMRFVRDRWLSVDLRTLGLFRIAFGLCLIANLVDHWIGGNL